MLRRLRSLKHITQLSEGERYEIITIQGNTISATSGSTHTIQFFSGNGFEAFEHIVTSVENPYDVLKTFSFKSSGQAEIVITGELKGVLEQYVDPSMTVSNGAISITNDGTNMKLINSAQSLNVFQHATFTFYGEDGGGGIPES